MINVSSQFKEELNNGNRNYLTYATIESVRGDVINLDQRHIWFNGFGFEENVSSSNSFDIGSAIINKATIVINNIYDDFSYFDFDGARVHMEIGLQLSDGRVERINLGFSDVDEAKYNGSLITLNCLDDMSNFDKAYSFSNLSYPATLLQIVQDACAKCDVPCGVAEFENSDYVVEERPAVEALTFRQVLCWVGQIACVWFKIDKFGRLNCGWYDREAYDSIDIEEGGTNEDKYHSIDSLSSINIAINDVVITGVNVEEYNKDLQAKKESYLEGTEDYVLKISDNKLIQPGKAQVVAQYIASKVLGLRFRPLRATFQNNPTIEAGDIATVTDYKGNVYKTLVSSVVFNVGSQQTIECGAESKKRNVVDRFTQQTQNNVETQEEIKKERQEREKAIKALNDALATSSGMYLTEEKQSDGSTITYLHDKPTIEESKNVIKITSEAIGISNDGGKTYPYGLFLTGDLIARLLYVVGINADHINTGSLRVEKDGETMLLVDIDTGRVVINADEFSVGGKRVSDITDEQIKNLQFGGRNLLLKSNEPVKNSNAPMAQYMIGEAKPVDGRTYTIQIKGELEFGKSYFEIYNSGSDVLLCDLQQSDRRDDGVYEKTFNWKTGGTSNSFIYVYSKPDTEEKVNSSIEWIKLEKGNKASGDWMPAPEDIGESIVTGTEEPSDKTILWCDTSLDPPLIKQWNGTEWIVVNDMTEEISSLRQEFSSEIQKESDGIRFEVSQNFYTKEEAEQLQSSIGTQFDQTKKDFTFTFNEFNKDLQNLGDSTNAEFQRISEYIRFENGNIEMGATDSEFKRLLTRTKDSYLQNGVEIAYFGNRKLYVTDGEFISSCMFGNFGLFPEENESLSFRKAR